jgi:phage terminase large subunit-like protein
MTEAPGALFKRSDIDKARVAVPPAELVRIVVAVDPATTANENSDETGIIVAGRDRAGEIYILEDRSGRMSPDAWARRAVAAFDEWKGDRIVAEQNQGGAMVELTIRHVRPDVPYTGVTATRGKALRAEPISSLYEQGKVHHCGGLADLEDQMTSWEPGDASPDRLDALVWACTELGAGTFVVASPGGSDGFGVGGFDGAEGSFTDFLDSDSR